MNVLKRFVIVFVHILIVAGLLIPQPLIAQVGDGTAGPSVTPRPQLPGVGPNPGGDVEEPPYVPPPGVGPDPGGDVEEPVEHDHDHELPAGSDSGSSNTGSDSSPYQGSPSGPGATEPPIELEVVDCPGVVRTINAFNLPPSIYPKPNCGGGTPGAGVTGPMGVCTTDPNVSAYGPDNTPPPDNTVFWSILGKTTGRITQGFGPTGYDVYGNYDYTLGVSGHPGVDVGADVGDPLYTPVDGVVVNDGGTGYFIHDPAGKYTPYTGELKIALSNGDEVVIGHMSQIDVRKGDQVKAGQLVGLVGESNGPHLHLEYRKKQDHPNGTHIALDPRDVFGCEAPGTNTDPTPAPPTEGTSGPAVEGASTEGGRVLQASVTIAPAFPQFQEKYGFIDPNGPSNRGFEEYKENFVVARDFAIKYAPEFDLEPEMVVWWIWFETQAPFDSWHYQNCHNNTDKPVAEVCAPNQAVIGSGDWQVGYGQQYDFGARLLKQAFEITHGNPNDASLVRQVGQNVIQNSDLSLTMPSMTIDQLLASEQANRQWIFTLQRDQAISSYLLAAELRSDMDGRPNMKFSEVMKQWGPYYGLEETIQRYSNIMNDVLLNWGAVGSGVTGDVCKVGVPSTNTNCSTLPDVLNGMTVEEFVAKINENIDVYRKISECANVPWEMMAAIHLRETSLKTTGVGAGGPWQFHPEPTGFDAHDFEVAGCEAAKMLAGKIEEQFAGENIGPLRSEMDPSSGADEYSIKAAFFGYNGTGGWEPNVEKGCTPALDGNDKFNWDCSAYVMNNMDSNHTGMCVMGLDPSQEKDDEGPVLMCPSDVDPDFPGNDGVWKVYYKLHYSTYDADGKLLVYGGKCTTANEVIDGWSAPTKPGHAINNQFFAPSHEGIDIANEAGDPIFAISNGQIIISGWVDEGGYYLILHIEARGSYPEMYVYYGHLEPGSFPEASAENPVSVQAGQQIGKTGEKEVTKPDGTKGDNGNTTGPHLHFDMRKTPYDPPREGHINPCILDVMKNSYPDLAC